MSENNQINQIPKKDRILFVHIPETGGGTMDHIIKNHLLKEKNIISIDSSQAARKNFLELSPEQILVGAGISGHISFRAAKNKLGDHLFQYFTLTILRHPVDWSISLYQYLSQRTDHFQHNQVKSLSFEEFIDSKYYPSNLQNRMICGDDFFQKQSNLMIRHVWLQSLKILENEFDVFGTLNDFDRILENICNHFTVDLPNYQKRNVSHKLVDKSKMSLALIDNILAKNDQDIKLYKAVKTIEYKSKLFQIKQNLDNHKNVLSRDKKSMP
jgi:hypothetical protein